MKNIVITISGAAGSGKDTFAKMLAEEIKKQKYEVLRLAYADSLKAILARNKGYAEKDKAEQRSLLQTYGELVRGLNEKFWVNQVWQTIDTLRSLYEFFIISDARHDNELRPFPYALSYLTYNIYIDKENNSLSDDEKSHPSEAFSLLSKDEIDKKFQLYYKNDRSLGDLREYAKYVAELMVGVRKEMDEIEVKTDE